LQVLLPPEILAKRHDLEIVFHHPICPPFSNISDSEDGRTLGFFFHFLKLRTRGKSGGSMT